VRTTGVGDRFNAGLSAGLLAGMSPGSALAMGCAAGAWFVSVGEELRADQVGSVGARLRSLGLG
jgi:sugar/nucleoside kinase (ribokinase family)